MSIATDLWRRAGALAAATPADRNRSVDFLRAASITVVVLGHWLMSAPWRTASGAVEPGNLLSIAPWTQALTLALQVMPIFFLVGGYSNAVAWRSAQAKGTPYGAWLQGRFQRLIGPVLPVLVAWAAIATVALAFGAPGETIGLLSQVALVPTWFLAVYVLVGVFVPLTWRAWERFGFGSFAALVAGAVAVDVLSFSIGERALALVNYLFVWLAIHQLGYAWQTGRFARPLAWAAVAGAATAALIAFGPYPLAMVGVPGLEVSNTSPPTLALLVLGVTQAGLVLALEPMMRRALDGRRLWTATVLVNGLIMSVYLWHMTAMIAVYAGMLVGGFGLDFVPDTGLWWLTRPVYLAAFALCLLPIVILVQRFERPAARLVEASRRRLVAGASLVCVGLALVSDGGVATASGLRLLPALLPLVGTGLAGFGPLKALAPARGGN